MELKPYFERYILIGKLAGTLIAKTPLRVGKGRGFEVTESDLPIIKDSKNVPILPGSSLKGFFRGNIERLLSGLNREGAVKISKEIFGGVDEGEHASAILFNNIPATKYQIENRKHIKIDPEKGSVEHLFDAECVMDGAVFEGLLATTRNLSPVYLSFLQCAADLASLGVARIGGFKSRGYGQVDINFNKMALILPGVSPHALSDGVKIQPTIGTGKEVYFETKNGKTKLREIDEVMFKAEVEENPQYFGVSIAIEGEELKRLLAELFEQLQKYVEEVF